MKAISPDLQNLSSVVVAVADPTGTLLESNAGFVRLFGGARCIGTNISECFRMPRFEELALSRPLGNGDVFRGSLHFSDAKGEVVQLSGKVIRSAFGLCLVAEAEVATPGLAVRAADAEKRSRVERETKPLDESLRDKVSGTGNRERLQQALESEILAAGRSAAPFCLLTVNLQGLSEVTREGQAGGGEKVLARIGFMLSLLTRPTDIVTRPDAARFVLVLPHTNLAQAAATAERIRKALLGDTTEPLCRHVTAQFGLAESRQGEGAQEFLARATADQAARA